MSPEQRHSFETSEQLVSLRAVAETTCRDSIAALRLAISPLDVVRDALLNTGGIGHLPVTSDEQISLCRQALDRISRRRHVLPEQFLAANRNFDLRHTALAELEEEMALLLHKGLHYLGMPRSGGQHLALYPESRLGTGSALLSIASLHQFDLNHLVPRVLSTREASESLVLSRVLALPGSPRNTISRLLGQTFRWVGAHRKDIRRLVTYNNPNLGFDGTIYRATNWRLIATEEKSPDFLLDGSYISLRELKGRYGSFNESELLPTLSTRLTRLPASLLPLEIYVYELERS